jgi:hypothetical protein
MTRTGVWIALGRQDQRDTNQHGPAEAPGGMIGRKDNFEKQAAIRASRSTVHTAVVAAGYDGSTWAPVLFHGKILSMGNNISIASSGHDVVLLPSTMYRFCSHELAS